MPSRPPPIVVVGAGIIGASVAWHLADRGKSVQVIDAGASPGGGVTSGAIGWLNSANGPTQLARDARHRALEHWKQRPFKDHVNWCGALRDKAFSGGVATVGPVGQQGWLDPEDGLVDPVAVTQCLLDAPRISLQTSLEVTGISERGVDTAAGRQEASAVVLAAGLDSKRLAPELPLWPGPVVSLDFGVQDFRLDHILCGWGVELVQRQDGRILGVAGLEDDPEMLRVSASRCLGREMPRPRRTVWSRPMTEDAIPFVGRLASGAYAAVGHPGIILAPAIGEDLAGQICDGLRETGA